MLSILKSSYNGGVVMNSLLEQRNSGSKLFMIELLVYSSLIAISTILEFFQSICELLFNISLLEHN